jgi:hypothetical protein
VLIESLLIFFFLTREAKEFVEKYEGALGKGKGKQLYAYKMLMAKVCGAEAANPGGWRPSMWGYREHRSHWPPFVFRYPRTLKARFNRLVQLLQGIHCLLPIILYFSAGLHEIYPLSSE